MKIRIIVAIIFIGFTAAVYSQVEQAELENLPPVVFINYEGPHTTVNTREEIRQIGVALGNVIAEREGSKAADLAAMSLEERRAHSYRFDAGPLNRYFIIHSVSQRENGKLDADIMGLGVDTLVDHVRNLRVILQGYLQSAYSYSADDALLLAQFITIYNAVYRGNWDYLSSRYKTPVMDNLTRERAGLSIRFDEWPGRTLMLIPLGHGGLSAIDTSVITDRRVIEELRKEEDQGVPQRQEMVNLMEREAERAEQRAQIERETARQEERQVAQERMETAQERQRVQEDQQAGIITQEEAAIAEEDLDRREQDLDRREEIIEERLEEAQRLEDFAERRMDEAMQQREEIARDQQAAIVQETIEGILGITIERDNPSMGRLILFNPETGGEIRRSPLDTVHVRTVAFTGGKILAVAGENVGNGAVRLIEINQINLVMARQGEDDIKPGSLLWVNGQDLYAITIDLETEECFLGRFNSDLVLQAKSSEKVHPEAGVSIQQGHLLTQRDNGSPLILNPVDLTTVY